MNQDLTAFESVNIAVIGDIMLDIFSCGISERLSPEAPVPVVRITKRQHCIGGAGNVARNLASLGVKAALFGVVGNDAAGETLRSCLKQEGIGHAAVNTDSTRPTTVKERFVVGQQQMLRVDHESTDPVSEELVQQLKRKLFEYIHTGIVHGVIFSDYNKGVLSQDLVQEIIDFCRKQRIVTTLDPKPNHLGPVQRLTVLKPNRQEAFALAGIKDQPFADRETRTGLLRLAAEKLYELYHPDYLVISLSADGIALYYDGKLQMLPTAAREVYDVSGAGDTLIATLSAALCAGKKIEDAVAIANIASGLAVAKAGTSTVSKTELEEELQQQR